MKNKELKMKLGQLQEEISKASLQFWKLAKEKFTLMRLILEEQQKSLQSFINNAIYHLMNPNADVTYQIVNLFSSDKCFICFISDCPHYI